MSTELNQPAITARIIPNNRRMAFLPRLFGAWYLTGEAGVYNLARSLCVDYQGGSWEFVALSFGCLLYTSDAADDTPCRALGGPRNL
ncbi:hypothetical protein [Klebsiella pneumoniae]|uniref:hypothetical protein n=1 Tax=Klebsiella pneumoniae TaxID=573 RepID=UPI00210EED8A|nr:hypothetical protein [Klebsiella pneumoniae]